MLLGAWADITKAERILDIGTGTGVIALMLAQRSSPSAHIDAIDISNEEFLQSSENFQSSSWSEKIKAHHCALQDFEAPRYDLIVSNPPFFIDSAKPPKTERARARHTETLSPDNLLEHVARLIKETGKFCVILPTAEGELFIASAKKVNLHCVRRCEFHSREHKPTERLLLEFRFHEYPYSAEKLVLYIQDEIWTEEYKLLTRDFYLKS